MNVLKRLIPFDKMKGTFARFPLSALCALGFFAVGVLLTHDVLDDSDNFYSRVLAVLGFGFFWFGIVRLLTEARKLAFPVQALAGLGVLGCFAAAVFLLPTMKMAVFVWMTLPVLLLAVGFVPYLFSGRDDLSFWSFNSKTWLGMLVAILAGLLWGIGGSLALLAVDKLLGIDVDEKLYADLWLASACLLTPLYALSWVPLTFDFTDEECRAPPQLSFVINWVLGPLTFVYLLILYAYFAKIAVTGEVPSGQLSYMTMGFAGAGVVTYLVSYPLREGGNALIRFLHRFFFPLLILPALMQGWALYERVAPYGITEQRYLVGMSAVFFLVSALVFTGGQFMKRPVSLRFPVALLAAFLLLGSVGPLSAIDVSERSQMKRLTALLEKYEMLKDGEIVKTSLEVPFDDRKNLSSMLDYFVRRSHVPAVKRWFMNEDDGDFYSPHEMAKSLGFEYVSRWETKGADSGPFSFTGFSGGTSVVDDVRGYDFILGADYSNRVEGDVAKTHDWEWSLPESAGEVWADLDDSRLYVFLKGHREEAVVLNLLDAVLPRLEAGHIRSYEVEFPVLDGQSGDLRVRLVLQWVSGKYNKNAKPSVQVDRTSFKLYVDFKAL